MFSKMAKPDPAFSPEMECVFVRGAERKEGEGDGAEHRVGGVLDDIAIRVAGLSKSYNIYSKPQDRLKQSVYPRLQRLVGVRPRSYYNEFWALKDISFDVAKGETVGVIGCNGSGKSTLLQLICGTLTPTSGSVRTNGQIAALLELGAGFNPEFTGRENVYLSGAVLGLKKDEIRARFDTIAKFADIGEFMEQPVKTYSSGMYVRLAFAVASHVDAQILVIDEALAVGDVFFAQKCMRYLTDFHRAGGTVLFVSHDLSAVTNLCNRAIWLDKGSKRAEGKADDICRRYLEQMYLERTTTFHIGDGSQEQKAADTKSTQEERESLSGNGNQRVFWAKEQRRNPITVSPFNQTAPSFGLGGARITDAGFFKPNGERLSIVEGNDDVCFSIFCTADRRIRYPAVGMMLKDRLGQIVFTEGTTLAFKECYEKENLVFKQGESVRVDFEFTMPVLMQGNYTISVAVAEGVGHDHVQHHWVHDAIALESLDSRLLHGIAGFTDIKMKITLTPEGRKQAR